MTVRAGMSQKSPMNPNFWGLFGLRFCGDLSALAPEHQAFCVTTRAGVSAFERLNIATGI